MKCKSMEKTNTKHRKGLWSPEEDQRLRDSVLKNNGHGCWSSVAIHAGLQRNGKSCRLRWINYLRPGLKRGRFTVQEEETILKLHHMLGNKWSQIAHCLPGRTDNEVKNHWHSYLKKKIEPPTPVTSSFPKILFVEWLTLNDSNCNNTVDTFSGFNHPPSFCGAMDSPSNLLQYDSLVPFTGYGELEVMMAGSSYYCGDMYGTMEDRMLESELLELVSLKTAAI